MSKILKVSLWTVSIVICSVGAIIQIENVCSRYFQYATKTAVSVDIPVDTKFPILTTCWRFNDIMNMNSFESERNIQLKRWNEKSFSWTEFLQKIKYLTVSDWFKYSPDINHVLGQEMGCRIRHPTQFTTSTYSNEECGNIYNITKFIQNEYICYRFDPNILSTIFAHEYAMSPGFTGLIYELFFDMVSFNSVEVVTQSIHSKSSSYLLDSIFSKTRIRTFDGHPSSEVSYREFLRIKKEPPYQPTCDPRFNDYGTAFEYWLEQANGEAIKNYNMITPFVPTYDSSLNSYIPSSIDFKNKTFVSIMNNLLQHKLNMSVCKANFFTTYIVLKSDKKLTVSVFWPYSETLQFKHIPDQELIDFIVYICSCIGIWFGLSAYSMCGGVLMIYSLFTRRHSVGPNVDAKYVKQMRRLSMKITLMKQYMDQINTKVDNLYVDD